jgi:hypothetical protein
MPTFMVEEPANGIGAAANTDALLSRTDLRELGLEGRAIAAILSRLRRRRAPRILSAADPGWRLPRAARAVDVHGNRVRRTVRGHVPALLACDAT